MDHRVVLSCVVFFRGEIYIYIYIFVINAPSASMDRHCFHHGGLKDIRSMDFKGLNIDCTVRSILPMFFGIVSTMKLIPV